MNDDVKVLEEIPPDQQARIALENATFGRNLCCMELSKYTRLRKHTAQAMGMIAPVWSDSDRACIMSDHLYPKALNDIAILFWLLTQPETGAEWSVKRAMAQPSEAFLVAIEWAGELGLTDPNRKLGDAYRLMLAIHRDISVSAFGIQVEGNTAREKKETELHHV